MTDRPQERGQPADTAVRPLTQQLKERLQAAAEEFRTASAAPRRTTSGRAPRRARLRLTRIDPWSVMKTAFLLSIALGVVTIVAVFIVWSVLGAAGVWDSINRSVTDVVGTGSSSNFDVTNYLGISKVMGFTMVVAVIDVVLFTAVATLAAFLYNMAAALVGGIEVTLTEDR